MGQEKKLSTLLDLGESGSLPQPKSSSFRSGEQTSNFHLLPVVRALSMFLQAPLQSTQSLRPPHRTLLAIYLELETLLSEVLDGKLIAHATTG